MLCNHRRDVKIVCDFAYVCLTETKTTRLLTDPVTEVVLGYGVTVTKRARKSSTPVRRLIVHEVYQEL